MSVKIIVVDDEPEIADGVAWMAEKLCPDCKVSAVAYGGEEGYERAHALLPDVILTDIKMPDCDGLAMIKKLRKENLKIRYIILTGYAEFEYARQAISLGVEDFITKPVEEDELKKVLSHTCQAVLKERKDKESLQQMKGIVKDYVLKEFLDNRKGYQGEVEKYLEQEGVCGKGKKCLCMAVEMDDEIDELVWRELLIGEKDEIESLEFLKSGILVEYSRGLFVLLGELTENMRSETVIARIESKKHRFGRKLRQPASIGLGFCDGPEHLPEAFEEARCALNYRILKGADCVISYEQIRDIEECSVIISKQDIEQLSEHIDRMDNAGIKSLVEHIFLRISEEENLSLQDLQMLSLNLVLSGIRKIPFVQFQMNRYLGKNIFSLESISKFRTMEQLQNWIVNILQGMNELMLRDDMSEKRDVIAEVKGYISKNFNREISLNEISEHFFINPYYFSHLFKKKTGETYQNYLIRLRMERAKKLLEETDLKVYEICERVGYSDTNHFIKMFARMTEMNPGEYRKAYKEGKD
ncbi:MAG: response regulator [Lachnospiraceae bacterium]|nr:response regulator [Lachnospiraceae bacterium]